MKKIRLLLISLILIAFDQWTKYLAIAHLKGTEGYDIIPGVFKLLYAENTGSAFSMFEGKVVYLLVSTTIILLGVLFVYFRLPMDKRYLPLRLIAMFVIAGAAGNLIDRVVYHYVVDFLYFELINFPIFNVADCYITVSEVVLIALGIFYYKDEDYNHIWQNIRFKKEK